MDIYSYFGINSKEDFNLSCTATARNELRFKSSQVNCFYHYEYFLEVFYFSLLIVHQHLGIKVPKIHQMRIASNDH